MQFQGVLEKYENNLWNYHIKIPAGIVKTLVDKNMDRFICTLNNGSRMHASMMPAGGGIFFIKVNKELRDEHSLGPGSEVLVHIYKDNSQYGMPLPKEMSELFIHDPEGDFYFHQLSPGKQRSLLYMVGKIKSSDTRIEKSIIILDHLKEYKGKLDFKILGEDFKKRRRIT